MSDPSPVANPAADSATAAFAALGLSPEVLSSLDALGYEEPTPVQVAAIPLLLAGQDVMGSAATGTGKTAAFALPLVERIVPGDGTPQALVLVPTRELAMQVAEAVQTYGRHRRVSVLPVYGGQPIERQLRGLRRGVDVVVGTPGRVRDHITRGTLNLSRARYVVLDEADEMLDMGFLEDLDAILDETPGDRQTALFSATFPSRVAALARRHLREPQRVAIEPEKRETPLVRQVAYIVPRPFKLEALGRVLDLEAPTSTILFCRTRTEVDELTEALAARAFRPEALHGGLAQVQRDRVMARFREGTTDLLVATDVAARGLDVEQVSHVINFDIPQSLEMYVHRIGRTGRAGREGMAITLVEPREHRWLKAIEKVVGQRIEPARIPTIADLRARRMELLRAQLEEVLRAEEHTEWRGVVESLGEQFDALDVAAAAVKVAADALKGDAADPDVEIPHWEPQKSKPVPRDPPQGAPPRGPYPPDRREPRPPPPPPREGGGRPEGVRLSLGMGRKHGIRPADVVGAITAMTDLVGRDIGAIEIGERDTLVEVPSYRARDVIEGLARTALRGRKVRARRVG